MDMTEEERIENAKIKVFISYNHDDTSHMEAIHRYLSEKGYGVISDTQDMRPGEEIQDFINSALKESNCILTLVSRNSLSSGWVSREMVAARILGRSYKVWIPLALDDSFMNDSFIDELRTEIEKKIEELGRRIRDNVNNMRANKTANDKYNRLIELRDELERSFSDLQNRLVVDISGDKFERGMEKVSKAVKSAYKDEVDAINSIKKKSTSPQLQGISEGVVNNAILERKIREIQHKFDIDRELGPIIQVNCDRRENRIDFDSEFDEKEKYCHHQFFFLTGTESQLPENFGEYMIFNRNFAGDSHTKSVLCAKRSNSQRVKVCMWSEIDSLNKTKNIFYKFFSNLTGSQSSKTFEKHVEEGFADIEDYSYAISIIKINASEWQPFMVDFFSWLFDGFSKSKKGVRFILFFVIQIPEVPKGVLNKLISFNRDVNLKRKIDKDLELLTKKYPECTHISDFNLVKKDDLVNWFEANLGIHNASHSTKEILVSLEDFLDDQHKKELFLRSGLLNMSDIADLLVIAWEVANESKQSTSQKQAL